MKNFAVMAVMLFAYVRMHSQSTLKGLVTDAATGEAIPFATVAIKDLPLKSYCDMEGNYELRQIPDGYHTIYFSMVGYEPDSVSLRFQNETLIYKTVLRRMILFPAGEALPPVIVETTRAERLAPLPFSELNKKEIGKLNTGQDMPYLLRMTPSLVTTSDAGNGIGYTGLWIRGSDPSRINITINGIPLNDPESQQVFWVDVPDLASSTDYIQIQRGVGTSTNGAGAFGGSIKLETTQHDDEASAQLSNGYGSFNTWRNSLVLNSGLVNDHWNFETRLSRISSDGYIDRAKANLQSYFTSASYRSESFVLKATVLGGHERTYQSWYGTPVSVLENDYEAMLAHAAGNGYTPQQTENLLTSGRTYNYYLYQNEVDDYTQQHYQLHTSKYLRHWNLNAAAHYTRGFGYFEQYRNKDELANYNLVSIPIASSQLFSNAMDDDGNPFNTDFDSQFGNDISTTYQTVLDENGNAVVDSLGNILLDASAIINQSDLVRRRWLSNHFYGGIASARFSKKKFELTLGSAFHQYRGEHFGELVWMEYANDAESGDRYYHGSSSKSDANVFAKAGWWWNNFRLYADVQLRSVNYSTKGTDNDLRLYDIRDQLLFFNPKAGVSYHFSNTGRVYASLSTAGREPARTDYVDNTTTPLAESMIDAEAGWETRYKQFGMGANAYWMQYKNQLVLTGALNDVGAALRENVPTSWRRGIEVEANYHHLAKYAFAANVTLSDNRIKSFTETIYDYTNGFETISDEHRNSQIAFSPGLIAALQAGWKFFERTNNALLQSEHSMELLWLAKYVGRQYLDNTTDESKTIAAYFTNDVQLIYSFAGMEGADVRISLAVNNVMNTLYSSNGYTYSYIYGEKITERFYYPQATRNFMLNMVLSF